MSHSVTSCDFDTVPGGVFAPLLRYQRALSRRAVTITSSVSSPSAARGEQTSNRKQAGGEERKEKKAGRLLVSNRDDNCRVCV